MVYCGKPSTGCQMCRTRRIKCDETKPTCNQCSKARRQCPGYRDHFDLLLRSENQAAKRRALGGNKKTGGKAQPPPEPFSSLPAISTEDTSAPPLPQSLSVPTEDLATCHFLANYVLVPRREEYSARGFMNFLIPLMNQQEQQHLKHAFNACALASLAGRSPGGNNGVGGECSRKGFGEYTRALSSTQAALQDPARCKEDSVLAAVLLLGMFECMTATQPSSSAWGSHVEGAIQIVKARGKQQLKTKLGLQLFVAVRTQLIIHTLSSATAPTMGTDWWISEAIHDSTAAACQRLNLLTAELRAEVHQAMAGSDNDCEPNMTAIELISSFIRRSQALDAQVSAWLRSLPPHWQFTTLCFSPLPSSTTTPDYTREEVYPGRIDTYPDFWIASLYNLARTARLILMSITVRCAAWACSPTDYRTTPEYAMASRQCVEVISDILASVPYHLGWHVKHRHDRDSQIYAQEKGAFACGEEEDMKALAGYFLTWPLACAMSQDYATDSQRLYIRGRLKYIGDGLGIKYSHILSQLQVRVPSMLIRRDGLLAQPYPMAHDFQRLVCEARHAPPLSVEYKLNPLQQREAMQRESREKQKSELLERAAGGGDKGRQVARTWLSV